VVDWRKPDEKEKLVFECIDLSGVFNDRVTQVFKNEYRSPRSPYCSLQIPLHGFGDWCYGGRREEPKIDDSALRAGAGTEGRLVSPQGIPLATPGPGEQPNIVFTSQWDNFPDKVVIPLEGRARHIYFLVAGTTHPMHSQFDNGEILVTYADGRQGRHPNTSYRSDVKTRSRWSLESAQGNNLFAVGNVERLPLHNPTTWWPIEADYDLAIDGFCVRGPHPPRIDLGAGRATLLDLPLDRELRSLTVRCLANEVVVGLMSATLLRP
jgi:hypothetical protein